MMAELFKIAVVGEFQRGKSTLVNCLLGRAAAKRGRGLRTTASVAEHIIAPGVVIVDTPGFNAELDDDKAALTALASASAVVLLREDKGPDNRFGSTVAQIRNSGKPCLFLCNFSNADKGWIPDAEDEAVLALEAELEGLGASDSFVTPPGCSGKAVPVNLLWALWAQGLAPEADDCISDWAEEELGMGLAGDGKADLRCELMRLSGFPPVREFLRTLPAQMLRMATSDPAREIERMLALLTTGFRKRWDAE